MEIPEYIENDDDIKTEIKHEIKIEEIKIKSEVKEYFEEDVKIEVKEETEVKQENDNIKITKLAQGLPVGGEIEQLDDGTLYSAFKNRVAVKKV